MNINDLQSYEVILSQHIEEVNSEAYLLKHKKSGADCKSAGFAFIGSNPIPPTNDAGWSSW